MEREDVTQSPEADENGAGELSESEVDEQIEEGADPSTSEGGLAD